MKLYPCIKSLRYHFSIVYMNKATISQPEDKWLDHIWNSSGVEYYHGPNHFSSFFFSWTALNMLVLIFSKLLLVFLCILWDQSNFINIQNIFKIITVAEISIHTKLFYSVIYVSASQTLSIVTKIYPNNLSQFIWFY